MVELQLNGRGPWYLQNPMTHAEQSMSSSTEAALGTLVKLVEFVGPRKLDPISLTMLFYMLDFTAKPGTESTGISTSFAEM